MPGALVVARREPAERGLSWGEVDWMIEVALLEMRTRLNYHPQRIIPVGGGGIIPAGIMAYRYYKKDNITVELMAPVYARSYAHDHTQHRLRIIWPDYLQQFDSANTLFVDDIVDTGETFKAIRERMPKSRFYSLVTKIKGQPDIASTFDQDNLWWNFPWEKVPTEPKG